MDSVSYCDDLIHSTYDDWILPELNELESLIDKSNGIPYIIGQYGYFPDIKTSTYWTNTLISQSEAEIVDFDDTPPYEEVYYDISSSYYVLSYFNSFIKKKLNFKHLFLLQI